MVAAAGVRTRGVDAAATVVAQERAADVGGGVFVRRERQDAVFMGGEARVKGGEFFRREMGPDVVGDEEDFVREDVHPEGAADRTARAAGQLDRLFLDDAGAELVEGLQIGAGDLIEAGDGFGLGEGVGGWGRRWSGHFDGSRTGK